MCVGLIHSVVLEFLGGHGDSLPRGVGRTRREPETIRWADLVVVRDHWARVARVGFTMPDDLVRNWLTFETRRPDGDALSLLSGSSHASVPVESLAADPQLALTICRHYLTHPGDREELASPTALQRWL